MFKQVRNLDKITRVLLLLIFFCLLFVGCAASNVSRYAATNVDLGVENAKNLADAASEGSAGDTYENLSQMSRGAIIGGTAGVLAGAMINGIGALPGGAVGLVFGASYGAYIETNINLADRLENRGAKVVELGDQVLIVIPSSRLFQSATSVVRPEAYLTLDLIAEYINQFTKILVKIAAYTDNTGSERVDISLSEQQAQSLAKYFMASGLDARLIYAVGYGGTRLITRNTVDWGGSDNYRIEITLEKLVV